MEHPCFLLKQKQKQLDIFKANERNDSGHKTGSNRYDRVFGQPYSLLPPFYVHKNAFIQTANAHYKHYGIYIIAA
jgi:hypothetical protein